MPEFIAIHLSDAALLGCALRAGGARLSLGEGEPAAGVGFFQSDDLLLRKRPLTGEAIADQLAEGVESEAALICSGQLAGAATPPRAYHEEATLPFRFRRWLISFAGDPGALAPARAALLATLPDFLRRLARGESAAEALVLQFLSRLRELGRLDDPELDGTSAARAMAAALGDAERALEARAIPRPPLAMVASNGRSLIALRRGHPLWLRSIDGLDTCARHEVSPQSSAQNALAGSHRALKARLLLSGPIAPGADEGLLAIPEGGLVAIDSQLKLHLM